MHGEHCPERLEEAQCERIWVVVEAQQAELSIRQMTTATVLRVLARMTSDLDDIAGVQPIDKEETNSEDAGGCLVRHCLWLAYPAPP